MQLAGIKPDEKALIGLTANQVCNQDDKNLPLFSSSLIIENGQKKIKVLVLLYVFL